MKALHIVGFIVVVVGLVVALSLSNEAKLGSIEIPLDSTQSAASSTVTATPSQILSATYGAYYRSISNGGNTDVWLDFGTSTGQKVDEGILLVGSSTIEFYGDKLYRGAISGVTRAGTTSTVTTIELY